MTDKRRTFALAARAAISEFYANPDNEREFQQWLKQREAGAQTATNETRAQPDATARPGTGAVATV